MQMNDNCKTNPCPTCSTATTNFQGWKQIFGLYLLAMTLTWFSLQSYFIKTAYEDDEQPHNLCLLNLVVSYSYLKKNVNYDVLSPNKH